MGHPRFLLDVSKDLIGILNIDLVFGEKKLGQTLSIFWKQKNHFSSINIVQQHECNIPLC